MNLQPMADQPNTTTMPSIEIVMSEVVANLAFVAHGLIEPMEVPDAADSGESTAARLADAEIAIDIAGRAFDRISARLPGPERASIARMLTELRLSYVKKRGL